MEYANAVLFLPHLHTHFTVPSNEGACVPLVLARVTERPVTQGVEQFSLGFYAPAGAAPLHGTHAIQHHVLGEFDLFIAPVGGKSADRTVYEACFSRHVRNGESALGGGVRWLNTS
jgi:hypothetical protein